MSHLENTKAAVDEHIKMNAVDQTQKSSEDSKSKVNQQKKALSMLSLLDDLTEELAAKKQVADDKKKLAKFKSDTDALGAKKGDSSDKKVKSKGSGSGKSSQSNSTSKGAPAPAPAPKNPPEEVMDPLLALVMAGIANQTETNQIITALGTAGEEISESTTEASNAGNDWQKNFYDHGLTTTDGQNPGQYNTGKQWIDSGDGKGGINPTAGPNGGKAWEIWTDGHYFTVPGYPNIPTQAQVQAAIGSDHKVNYDYYTACINWCKDNKSYGKDRGFQGTSALESVSNGIPAATGAANSAEFNALIQIWQYVQQQVSQINNQFQTVAGLPSTMMQTLTQAVNTANSGQSSTVQAMGTTTNLVNGWAGV